MHIQIRIDVWIYLQQSEKNRTKINFKKHIFLEKKKPSMCKLQQILKHFNKTYLDGFHFI